MNRTAIFLLLSLLAAAPVLSQSPAALDQEYSAKIREYTTSPQFLTDLVSSLPASATVPSPLKFLGHIAGAPDTLTYAEDVYRYMRALEQASPRVKVFSIGKSEEGREMIAVAVSDEQTMANLDRYRSITQKLSDPRKIGQAEAEQLIGEGKPVYYATGAMHSPETGSPEMLMELAYRLAVDEGPMIRNIRANVITLITPVLEVDGRDRMVDIVRWHMKNPTAAPPPLVYWGHYVGHDDNRDQIGLTLALSRNVLKTFDDWHPQVVHDLHESIPFLYISTGTGPYNAWLDPLMIDEWHRMAYHEVQELTALGLPGVWTHGFYDGWAPNYMFWVGMGRNSIGRFYETFGNLTPETADRVVRDPSQRAWYRPNPPLPKVRWSLRNNVNYQQSGLLLALSYMAENRRHYLEQYWTLAKRSVAKARTEGPAAYVFNADQKRKGQLRDLMTLLREQGIEVQVAERPFSVRAGWPPPSSSSGAEKTPENTQLAAGTRESVASETTPAAKTPTTRGPGEKPATTEKDALLSFAAGSFVVRMDQPYSRLADALLDTQYVRAEEQVYDDTGWTLGYLSNVDFKRIVNPDVLAVPMHPWNGAQPRNVAVRNGIVAVSGAADTDVARLRYQLPSSSFAVTTAEIKGKTTWPAGTLLVTVDDKNRDAAMTALASVDTPYELLPSSAQPKSRPLTTPRIALLHTWTDTQEEGWWRIGLEQLGIPYSYISTQDVAKQPDLRASWDVILFPPAGDSSPADIIDGLPPGPALPWMKTELTPNLGVPDETEDMRPGLGVTGAQNLQRFVESGGLLVTCRDTARWAAESGLARYVSTVQTRKLKAPGSIVKAELLDPSSAVAAGFDSTFPVHFAGSPVFRVGVFRRREEAPRPSGRGSKTDPDVPQGRPWVDRPEPVKSDPAREGFEAPDGYRFFAAPYIPSEKDRPRVIAAFPKDSGSILLSGMLDGAEEIAGTPMIIDSPLGKGHILLFANNPMWRGITRGSYPLVVNAILNWDRLSVNP